MQHIVIMSIFVRSLKYRNQKNPQQTLDEKNKNEYPKEGYFVFILEF